MRASATPFTPAATQPRARYVAPALIAAALTTGCILDDGDRPDQNETDGVFEPGETIDAFEQLAGNCSYSMIFLTAYEAAEEDPEGVPQHRHLYEVSDECLQQTEDAFVTLGVTFTFDGPIETDPVHRTVVEGLHYMLFSPLMAAPAGEGGIRSVFGLDAQYPYPDLVEMLVPQAPASYEWTIPEGFYNEALAQFFVAAVSEIVDGTDNGESKTARYEGGVITLLDLFAADQLGDPAGAAGTLVHEAAHVQGLGHKYCNVSEEACDPAPTPLDADCDCDYDESAYWIEVAFLEAAALGRVVSFAPGANEPIDAASSLTSRFNAGRCKYAYEHVNPFRFSDPDCSSINAPLVTAIEDASDYWDDGL